MHYLLKKVVLLGFVLAVVALLSCAIYLFPIPSVVVALCFLFTVFFLEFRHGKRWRAFLELLKELLFGW